MFLWKRACIIYTKALADRILSSVQRSKNLRVKPGSPVGIFYLFKISSKKLISRIYIYIYTKSLIFWAYKLWKYISELFYLLDPCMYIYIWFSAFSMVYFIRWRLNINKINNFISIYSSKKEPSLVSLVCWNILSVGFMYIYRFSAPSMDYWLLYPTKNELLTFQLVNLGDLVELHILSMKPQKNCFIKKWISLEYSICWFNVYIYIGFLHPSWITDYCIQQRMSF